MYLNKAYSINVDIISFHKAQRIFHLTTLLINEYLLITEYYQIMWVLVVHNIFWTKTTFVIMSGKDNIFRSIGRHFTCLFLRTREGHIHHDTVLTVPTQGTHSRDLKTPCVVSLEATRRDNGITDVPIQFAGLVYSWPVSSSPLHAPRSGAHWPNGMEQLPPFHRRQIRNGCSTNRLSFHPLYTVFLSTIISVIYVVTATQHSFYLKTQNPLKYGSQLCIHITCCSANSSLIYQLYFNIINMAQYVIWHKLTLSLREKKSA